MGVINTTSDSFYAESRINSEKDLIEKCNQMVNAGATILDVGGYSSRPGSTDIPVEEEIKRIGWALKIITNDFPRAFISIDTFRSTVAKVALDLGAHIINDISGGQMDLKMMEVAAKNSAPYILMHMRGSPQEMQQNTSYDDLLIAIQRFFSQQIMRARTAGVHDIILDPGFGFSKTIAQNFKLMRKLEMFHLHDCPILVGISRKSMIYKTIGTVAADSLNGTTVLNTYALSKGAAILRVHDVKEAIEAIDLVSAIRSGE